MEWFDRVLAKRDDVIPSFMSVDAINSYVDNSIQLDQPEMAGAETAADIALGEAEASDETWYEKVLKK